MPILPRSTPSPHDRHLTDREPRIFPATGRGLGIEAVRHRQIHVDDAGALRLGDGAGSTVLAAPGAVRRIVLLDADALRPRLMFVGEDGPLVVLALEEYLTSPAALTDPAADLHTSGAAAIATALGVPIEHGGDDLAHLARGVPVLGPRPRAAGAAALRSAVALALVSLVAVAALAVHPVLLLPIVVVGAALVVGPVLTIAGLRARAVAAMTTAPTGVPGTDDLRRLAPTHPDARAQRTAAVLLLGPRRIIEIHHGGETWLPGPAAGGAVTAQVTPESILLSDASGRSLARLEGGWATEPAEFQRVCAQIGIRVSSETTPMAEVPGLGRLEPWRPGEGPGRGWALDTADEGGISVATASLVTAVLPFLLVVGLLCGLWRPWAVVFALPGAALLVVHLRASARLRRWRRGDLPMTEAGA